ncbi:MAG: hypothetical protein KBT53_02750 [Porticoccus sp.]|nr:hypothetical protein [Porticoccus sp.]MBQ0808527.1 hypothetical protein [Porticoccus sp.]
MNKLKYTLVVFSLIFSSLSYAELEDANVIRSVWDMKSQSCNGVLANDMSRNVNEENIKATKTIDLQELGLRFKVPQYPQVEEVIVKLNLGDRSRGVTDNYILISDQDLEPPFAAIVITELPAQMATMEQAFSAVTTLENQLAMKSGYNIELEKIDGPHGPSLQMVINNRVGSYCYPTSDFKFVPTGYDVTTIGISRFSFINGKLVEFSIVIAIPENISKSESVGYAEAVMDGYWKRLTII